ncbi:MAG: HprK-related kinase A [Pseudomonadales bacterium]|nr:HprK-related kinase A [Pseudomonadales bacterium]
MNISEITESQLSERLSGPGLILQAGPFVTRLHSSIALLAKGIHGLYADYPIIDEDLFVDFHVRVNPPVGLRRWFRPQARFRFDNFKPFTPLPLNQAVPIFEWGLNWCISNYAHQYLIVHSAVVERNGVSIIFPAPPGSGKSTLCAALVSKGWRLLSDEMALVDRKDMQLVPVPRPVSLKNQSIDLIRDYAPDMYVGSSTPGTTKGTIAHLAVPESSIKRQHEKVKPSYIVFPKYSAGAEPVLQQMSKPLAGIRLIENCFNYHVLGEEGFDLITELVDVCECLEFNYSKLDDALSIFNELSEQ